LTLTLSAAEWIRTPVLAFDPLAARRLIELGGFTDRRCRHASSGA
jgi:hypothetical protein